MQSQQIVRSRPAIIRLIAATMMAGLASAPAIAQAQSSATDAEQPRGDAALDDIVVTATKTGATRLQDTPMAISAFGGDALQRSGVRDMRDLTQLTPSMTISENSSFAQVYIRGVGSNNVFAGSDASSTVHMDGVYLARPASYFNSFLDVERVEVLRGPQGTLYGRNSVGGTINVISRRPDDNFRGKLDVGYGNYDAVQLGAYLSGPLGGDFSASIAGLYTAHDAYVKNINPRGNDIDDDDTKAVRGQLRWNPSAGVDVVLRADYLHQDSAIMSYSKLLELRGGTSLSDSVFGDYSKIANNFPHTSRREGWGVAAEASFALTPNLDLKSITAYRESDFAASFDTDASDLDLNRTILHEMQSQKSQEFNLTGKFNRLSFVIGAYYFTETIDYPLRVQTIATNTETFSTPHVKTKNWAGFGQASFAFTDTLTATAGLRYSKEDKDFTQNRAVRNITTQIPSATQNYTREGNYSAWTPKFGLEWRPQADILAYASASRGFKSGGFINSSPNPAQGFGPEYLWSYEGGLKTSWLDRRLQLNLSLFYYDYTDLQVNFFIVPGQTDIRNAANATIKGAELELRAIPVEGLTIEGNLSLLDGVYKDFTSAPRRNTALSFDASGQKLSATPSYTLNLAVEKSLPELAGWRPSIRAEGSWNGRRYFTPENTLIESQAPYFLLNASLVVASPGDRFSVTLWGRNLTDRQYVTGTASFAASRVAGRTGNPRTFGLRLGYKFD